ncbi:MAG: HAD family phosphatase [Bacteroidales bacterium]|nr:HAD family phosphatase [Bacteroidales bacterium]
MIKAILFDLGGVLIDLDFEGCVSQFVSRLGFEKIRDILDRSNQRGIYQRLEGGDITPEVFRSTVLKGSRPECSANDVDACMESLLGEMAPYKVKMLEDLSERIDVYMLSNNNPISMKKCREIMRLAGLCEEKVFKSEFLSYELNLLKPSEDIYKEVVRRIGLPAEEILFFDDSTVNVESASKVGIKAVLYNQGDDLASLVTKSLEDFGC